MTAKELLQRTRKRLENPNNWTKGAMRNMGGQTCLVGALRMEDHGRASHPYTSEPYRNAYRALQSCAGAESLTAFNDSRRTIHADTLRIIDCAIDKS